MVYRGIFVRSLVSSTFLLFSIFEVTAVAQIPETGNIAGQIQIARGNFPPEALLVTLETRGAMVGRVYTDGEGRFGFYELQPNPYHVVINEKGYFPIDETVVVNPVLTRTNIIHVTLTAMESTRDSDREHDLSGSNPYLKSSTSYMELFPKKVVKEFEKGVASDHAGKTEDAIQHYEKALQMAPDFYAAHNNLGSDYLAKSDFPAARSEFARAIELNQSDSAAYFNLGNVSMLMGQLADAQQYLNEGMRRQPDSALGHFLLGSLDIRIGKYDQAEAALRQAIQLSPVMAQARLQLVNLLVQRGRKADAVAQLHEFVAAFPDSSFTPKARALMQKLESSADAQVPN
jgi:tetratricopeptide (TPR) repeat protein